MNSIVPSVTLCCLAAAACILPARAANPGSTPEYPTRFANMGKPMDALLNSGFRVTAVTLGLDTVGFALEHDGKLVFCSVRNAESPSPDTMLSQCFALN